MRTLPLLLFTVLSLSAQTSLSLDHKQWFEFGSPKLYNINGGALAFDFPTNKNKSMNYLYTSYTSPLTQYDPNTQTGSKLVITLSVVTTGSPVFDWHTAPDNNCDPAIQYCTPANARPLIWGYGPFGDTVQTSDRWWPKDVFYVLGPGTVTLIASLDPANWSGVLGESAVGSEDWRRVLAAPAYVGLTFGGGYFYGHGVFIDPKTGIAQFQLQSYQVANSSVASHTNAIIWGTMSHKP